ncbi:hypothetical protein A7S34_21880 [Salmonella enterica]|nr:hypothetical protein SEEI0720_024855 [Salmonella enterica subsp. enterica serovar Inverness str. ATCC 10720]EAA7278994.1 hypothetical protein [Salmonella enterica]EAQ5920649.1 hypothetical protein [Salmonella enterica subsp. enterica serovar Inverness]EAW1203637.1 hypothetical protein [Salmonella enterica subsp. enterica]OHF38204.1 hypothetical protein A7S42_20500 [Salmonella enterica subsp. diarizonae serovar 38:[k]:-]OHM14886.1 hypothetical protein A7T20_23825 [Salmonella enterica subsp. 
MLVLPPFPVKGFLPVVLPGVAFTTGGETAGMSAWLAADTETFCVVQLILARIFSCVSSRLST